jgi:hypothetical protein
MKRKPKFDYNKAVKHAVENAIKDNQLTPEAVR